MLILCRDGGGTITKDELSELMDILGIDASPEEVDLMIKEVCILFVYLFNVC